MVRVKIYNETKNGDFKMNILVYMKFGSHLYGTDTPNSDTDFKGVFLPELRDCVLNRIPKSINEKTKTGDGKNTCQDVDKEIYSLQYFMELAFKGETVAIDMLHAPLEFCESYTPLWEAINKNRSRFYTKNLSALVGYAKTQAAKYGIKGSRLSDSKRVFEILSQKDPDKKLGDVLRLAEESEILLMENVRANKIEKAIGHPTHSYTHIDVCGRNIDLNSPVKYALNIIQTFINNYGARAQLAEKNEGIDWKAVSHAFRAAYQLKEIYETGDLHFPLKERDFLRQIKQGAFHYKNDSIGQTLDLLIDEVKALAEQSSYPEKVDKDFFHDLLLAQYI